MTRRQVKREPGLVTGSGSATPASGGANSSSRIYNGETQTRVFDSEEYAQRRLLRSRYRDVKRIIIDDRDDVGGADSDKFNSIINQVETLYKLVQKPREQVSDADALLDITNSVVASVKAHGNDGITPSAFVNCILRDFRRQHGPSSSAENGRDSVAWKDVGFAVSHIFRVCPGCHTMIGPMHAELKQWKAGGGRRCKRPTEKARPEEVNDHGAKERTDTDKNMSTMFSILINKRSVKLENLVLNRNSFAQTVENLFALSFLVKDGRAEIKVNEDGWHLVSPKNAPASSKVISGEVAYRHFVFRLDFKDWKLMASSVEIGEELMPNRDQASMPSDSQPDPLSEESQGAGTTTPIRKLSRNRGLVLQDETIVEDSSPESDIRKLSRNRGLILQEETVVEDSSPESSNTQAKRAAIRKGKRKMW